MRRGYTLIELLVTVTIMVLLTVVSYPSISKMADVENLRTTGSELRHCYLLAKNYARAPQNAAATSYQAVYNQQGCRVVEVAAVNTVINEYRFAGTDYQFKNLSGATTMTITISTAPPYEITATEGSANTNIAAESLLIEVTNTANNTSRRQSINKHTGVIKNDV
ncbi:MAG: prepilin-type N-terminal cleavage/methylation domain-containing protein [bacterium]|nr:prepilin-type N-terminal cleavage/methylation domain-containing protein [bacterium]